MDARKELQENLREAASIGDEVTVRKLVVEESVDVNNQHSINGWTALHWASKRGHIGIVSFLLQHGADRNIKTSKGETPADVAADSKCAVILGGEERPAKPAAEPGFTPSYIANPPFPYVSQNSGDQHITSSYYPYPPKRISDTLKKTSVTNGTTCEDELVLKVRIANLTDKDFIEIELPRDQLTFANLFGLICEELSVAKDVVYRLRKLPDTIVRKDKDVQRLPNFQEIEVVLTPKGLSQIGESCRGYSSPAPKHVDVVY